MGSIVKQREQIIRDVNTKQICGTIGGNKVELKIEKKRGYQLANISDLSSRLGKTGSSFTKAKEY